MKVSVELSVDAAAILGLVRDRRCSIDIDDVRARLTIASRSRMERAVNECRKLGLVKVVGRWNDELIDARCVNSWAGFRRALPR